MGLELEYGQMRRNYINCKVLEFKGKFFNHHPKEGDMDQRFIEGEEAMELTVRIWTDPKLIHYIGMIIPPRPGIQRCLTMLEYLHFPPCTPLNDEYQFVTYEFSGILFGVVSIPKQKKHLMETIADESGLRIVKGVPTLLSSDRQDSFPIQSSDAYSLENKPGHSVYNSTQQQIRAMLIAEYRELEDRFGI